MVRAGVVKPAIARRYRLEEYAEAMNAAFNGKEAGRDRAGDGLAP